MKGSETSKPLERMSEANERKGEATRATEMKWTRKQARKENGFFDSKQKNTEDFYLPECGLYL